MLIYFYSGPGLAIRIICGDEPYQGSEFAETNIILGQIVDFVTAIKKVSRVCERMVLIMLKSNKSNYSPVWLRLARFVPVGMLKVNFCLLESTALYALTATPTPPRVGAVLTSSCHLKTTPTLTSILHSVHRCFIFF